MQMNRIYYRCPCKPLPVGILWQMVKILCIHLVLAPTQVFYTFFAKVAKKYWALLRAMFIMVKFHKEQPGMPWKQELKVYYGGWQRHYQWLHKFEKKHIQIPLHFKILYCVQRMWLHLKAAWWQRPKCIGVVGYGALANVKKHGVYLFNRKLNHSKLWPTLEEDLYCLSPLRLWKKQ